MPGYARKRLPLCTVSRHKDEKSPLISARADRKPRSATEREFHGLAEGEGARGRVVIVAAGEGRKSDRRAREYLSMALNLASSSLEQGMLARSENHLALVP